VRNAELNNETRHLVSYQSKTDDEAASGAPEHSLSGNAQTSRRRLAMTRQAVGEISMPIPAHGFLRNGECQKRKN